MKTFKFEVIFPCIIFCQQKDVKKFKCQNFALYRFKKLSQQNSFTEPKRAAIKIVNLSQMVDAPGEKLFCEVFKLGVKIFAFNFGFLKFRKI